MRCRKTWRRTWTTGWRTVGLDEIHRRAQLRNGLPAGWSVGLWLWRDVRKALREKEADPATTAVMEACARAASPRRRATA